MNIFQTCNHHGGYCLWINRQIYTGMLKIGTFFLEQEKNQKINNAKTAVDGLYIQSAKVKTPKSQ